MLLELRRSAEELGSSPSAPVANWSLRGKKAWKRCRNRAARSARAPAGHVQRSPAVPPPSPGFPRQSFR